MSKKLWDWFYLKPVDHLDILSSENIDKGRKLHEAIHKRMKELIVSGPPLKVVGPTSPICFEHFVDDIKKVECDCEVKILKNRNSKSPITSWFIDDNPKIDKDLAKDLHVVYNGPAATGKVEKLPTRWSIIDRPSNEKYNFINFSFVNDPIDLNAKLQRNGRGTRTNISSDSINPQIKENKSSQVSICSSCNYYNEWIPFDPDYKCYKCKNGL